MFDKWKRKIQNLDRIVNVLCERITQNSLTLEKFESNIETLELDNARIGKEIGELEKDYAVLGPSVYILMDKMELILKHLELEYKGPSIEPVFKKSELVKVRPVKKAKQTKGCNERKEEK